MVVVVVVVVVGPMSNGSREKWGRNKCKKRKKKNSALILYHTVLRENSIHIQYCTVLCKSCSLVVFFASSLSLFFLTIRRDTSI